MQPAHGKADEIRTIAAVLFAKKGFSAVGVAELGDAVGLGRGALYHHIKSKDDLLYDISSGYVQLIIDEGRRISQSYAEPEAKIHHLSRSFVRVIFEHLPEMTVCFREIHALTGKRHEIVSQLHSDYEEIWENAIAEGTEKGVFRSVSKIAIKGLMGMYLHSFLWLKPDGPLTHEEVADTFSEIVLKALKISAQVSA